MTTNAYLVYWCEEGLESVTPITKYEHIDMENTFRVLNDQEPVRNPVNTIVQNMILRAQFNSQRHYELYAIDCDSNITKQDLEIMFNDTPQAAADLIRDRGHRLYSNRVERNRVKIV
jgi:cytidylate kinase